MTIAELIAGIRLDLTDKDSTRWTDNDLLEFVKKAARRLQHILFRNDIQIGKAKHDFTTVADTASYALPTDFMVDVGLWRDDGVKLEKLSDDQYYGAISGSECVAYYLLDKLYIYATPVGVRSLTLLYWPRVDVAPTITMSSSAWTGGDERWQPWGWGWTLASSTPYGGRFDDILAEYVIFRAKNVDEMDVTEEKALLADMENTILASYGSVAPTLVRGRGWLP